MTIPTPIKNIDNVLRAIHDHAVRGLIWPLEIEQYSGVKDDDERNMILEHLVKDEYVLENANGSYSIRFPGVTWVHSGGYEAEMVRNDIINKQQQEIMTLQSDLANAQLKDIPVNAIDRKTIIFWQIVSGVAILVAFLLKLFGAKPWL